MSTPSGCTLVPLPNHGDGRGAVFRPDDATLGFLGAVAEIHVVTILPGKTRGNHYHVGRREVLVVDHDEAVEVAWRDGVEGATERRRLEGPGAFALLIAAEAPHAIRNVGGAALHAVSLSDGRLAPGGSDTVRVELLG